MSHDLDFDGYRRTIEKLERLRRRALALESRSDLSAIHLRESTRSYQEMIRQLEAEIAAFEGAHPSMTSPLG